MQLECKVLNHKEIVASNLRRIREDMGLTQAEMAEKVSIPHRTYVEIELAHSFPRPETFDAIVDATGVSHGEILADPSLMPEYSDEDLVKILEKRLSDKSVKAGKLAHIPADLIQLLETASEADFDRIRAVFQESPRLKRLPKSGAIKSKEDKSGP